MKPTPKTLNGVFKNNWKLATVDMALCKMCNKGWDEEHEVICFRFEDNEGWAMESLCLECLKKAVKCVEEVQKLDSQKDPSR